MISDTYIKNRNFNLSSISELGFQKEYYDFIGWKSDLCGDTLLTDNQMVKFNADDAYISAQWKSNSNLIMTSSNGISCRFKASQILSSLRYQNSDCVVQYPYNEKQDISAPNSIVSVKDINKEITSVADYSFYKCYNLSSISCIDVLSIGNCSFQECSSLVSIYFPNVLKIGEYAFDECTNITSVNCPNVLSIGMDSFLMCRKLSSVNIQEVRNIESASFGYCNNIISICLPHVSKIGNYSFNYCTSLSSVDISNAVDIGEHSFYNCTDLNFVNCPQVSSIGSSAFGCCYKLSSVCLSSVTSPTIIQADTFEVYEGMTPISVYVPYAMKEDFEQANVWKVNVQAGYVKIIRCNTTQTVSGEWNLSCENGDVYKLDEYIDINTKRRWFYDLSSDGYIQYNPNTLTWTTKGEWSVRYPDIEDITVRGQPFPDGTQKELTGDSGIWKAIWRES